MRRLAVACSDGCVVSARTYRDFDIVLVQWPSEKSFVRGHYLPVKRDLLKGREEILQLIETMLFLHPVKWASSFPLYS